MRAKCVAGVLLGCGQVLAAVLTLSIGSMLALPAQAQTVDFPEDFSKLTVVTSQLKGLSTGPKSGYSMALVPEAISGPGLPKRAP
jgi:hypothetical protein